jgi:hypothetical protein
MTNCPLTSELRASRKFIADRLEEPFESVIEVGCQLGENLSLFHNYCLETTAEKLSDDVFNAEPWNSYGYFIEITL